MSDERRDKKAPVAVMGLGGDAGGDPICDLGQGLAQRALRRAKQKGISPSAALKEIAEELPEPARGWALDTLAQLTRKPL